MRIDHLPLDERSLQGEWLVHVELGGERMMRPRLPTASNTPAQAITTQALLACQFDPFFACSAFCLFFGARTGEDVRDPVIGLVTRELEDRSSVFASGASAVHVLSHVAGSSTVNL